MRAAVLPLLWFALLSMSAPASAQREPSLGWVRLPGAESCIGTQALATRVERRLGRRVFVSASQSDLALEGRVERGDAPDTWRATLVMSDRRGRVLGRRNLRAVGPDCSALDDSLTLVIAIAIDPGTTLPAPRPTEQGLSPETAKLIEQLGLPQVDEQGLVEELALPEVEEETRHGTEPEAGTGTGTAAGTETETETGPAPGTGVGTEPADAAAVELAASALALLGVLPGTALALDVEVSIVLSSGWALSFGALQSLPRERFTSAARARFWLFAAGAGLCPPALTLGALSLRTCAIGRLGALSARGLDLPRRDQPTGLWAEALLQVKLLWNVGDFFVQAGGALGPSLVRDSFRYVDRDEQARELYRPAVVHGRFGIGLGLRFR